MISFDDSTTAGRVSDVLELLGRNLKKEEGRLFHQWWNIETMAFTSLRELAAVEAALADMIILGVHDNRELPETLVHWLNRLVDLRQARPGALLAVLDSDEPSTSGTSEKIISQLKKTAALGHLDFFATWAREGRDTVGIRNASEAARQFVVSLKSGVPHGLPGEGKTL